MLRFTKSSDLHVSEIYNGYELLGCHVWKKLPDRFVLDTRPQVPQSVYNSRRS